MQVLKRVLTDGEDIWPGKNNRRAFFQSLAQRTYANSQIHFDNKSLYLNVWPEVMAELVEELEVRPIRSQLGGSPRCVALPHACMKPPQHKPKTGQVDRRVCACSSQ